jgi:hypothetical protein
LYFDLEHVGEDGSPAGDLLTHGMLEQMEVLGGNAVTCSMMEQMEVKVHI